MTELYILGSLPRDSRWVSNSVYLLEPVGVGDIAHVMFSYLFYWEGTIFCEVFVSSFHKCPSFEPYASPCLQPSTVLSDDSSIGLALNVVHCYGASWDSEEYEVIHPFQYGTNSFVHNRSAKVLPNKPNMPPAIAQPKRLHVLSANCSGLLEICTTAPAH